MGWLAHFLINLAAQFSGFTNWIAAVLLTILAVVIWTCNWHWRRMKDGKPGVQTWYLLIFGIAGTWVFMTLAMGTAIWALYRGQNLGSAIQQVQDEGPLQWFSNLTMEGGLGKNVYSLRFRGFNASQKEVQLKDANIISAINGTKLPLEIVAGNDGIIPIDEAGLVPPGAPLELVAKFNLPDGLEAKAFLETWRQFFFNVEDDSRKYRLPFNEAQLAPFFPGMVGPRVMKRSDVQK
jgi:hypothetical protein